MNSGPMPHEPPQRRKTSFKGDVLRLVAGTGLAQLIGVLVAPILTRLYAPEVFGVAALFTSLTGILGVLACMRYELSIVLPDNDRGAANLLGVSLCFSTLIALLTVPIIVFAGPEVLQWVRMPELTPYLWLVSVTVFIHGVFTALNYWNTRTKHFTRLSIARVTSSLASTSATLGAGFAGHATGGAMIAASVGGQVVATTVLGGQIWRDNGQFLVQSITWREMLGGLKRYKRFPIFDSWSALLNTTSVQMPVLILGVFFAPAIVGFYALGHRLLSLPMGLLGGAISQVFFQRASVAKTDGSIAHVVESTFQQLLLIAAFPFLLLIIIAPELFSMVFGAQWVTAGIYVQILAPWLFFVSISSPLSTLILVLENQGVGLLINIALVISRVASLIIGGVLGDVVLALALFSSSGTLIWAWFCIYLVSHSGVKARKISRTIVHNLLTASIFIAPAIVVKWVVRAEPITVLAAGMISTLGYYVFTILHDRRLRKTVLSIISRVIRGIKHA